MVHMQSGDSLCAVRWNDSPHAVSLSGTGIGHKWAVLCFIYIIQPIYF